MKLKKKIHVIGGGTFAPVRTHLAVCAPAFGRTAKLLRSLYADAFVEGGTHLHLTKMANPEGAFSQGLVTSRS